MSLVARHLEAGGIPTVILGSALDIVEHCGVARFAFTDYPLGNPVGRPYRAQEQRRNVAAAVSLFETAEAPRTTLPLAARWGDNAWRSDYLAVREEDLAELRRKGEERRAERQALRVQGRVRAD